MAQVQLPDFQHRHNSDKTIDSICLYCFQTIATVSVESELAPFEKRHSCYLKQQPRSAPFDYIKKDKIS